MSRFSHIAFVCTKERAADDPKGSCFHRGSPALLERMKELTARHKLKGPLDDAKLSTALAKLDPRSRR